MISLKTNICNDCFYLLDVHSEEEVVGFCCLNETARMKCRDCCSFFSRHLPDYPGDTQLSFDFD